MAPRVTACSAPAAGTAVTKAGPGTADTVATEDIMAATGEDMEVVTKEAILDNILAMEVCRVIIKLYFVIKSPSCSTAGTGWCS